MLDTDMIIGDYLSSHVSACIGDKDLGFSSQIKTDNSYDGRCHKC
jgi:hypothetical protein